MFPTIGALPLVEIDTAIILRTLLPIWSKTPETASRLRGRMERVFAWAKAHKLFHGENPASLAVLQDALPSKPEQKHHPAMRYAVLPAFMADLRQRDSISARALEFTILTATRTSETLGAKWSEIDLEFVDVDSPGKQDEDATRAQGAANPSRHRATAQPAEKRRIRIRCHPPPWPHGDGNRAQADGAGLHRARVPLIVQRLVPRPHRMVA